MILKLAFAQNVLRCLAEKRAGIILPIAAGMGIMGTAHLANKSVEKAKHINGGFYPQSGGH